MDRLEADQETTNRWQSFWWQIGAVVCGIMLISKVADASDQTAQFVDCKPQTIPATQVVDMQSQAGFDIATEFNEAGRVILTFSRVKNGYYVDFGQPGENLLVQTNELSSHEDGILQAIAVNKKDTFVTQLTKEPGEKALVTTSCELDYTPKPGEYAEATIVP